MIGSIHRLALRIAEAAGSPWTVLFVALLLLIVLVAGLRFGLSDDWRWAISLTGTAVTLLMIFILQSSENRHTRAVQLKLDELLRGVEGPRARFIHLEDLTRDELDDLERELHTWRTSEVGPEAPPPRPRQPAK
jgi:low affinity Fe/Cu permease